MSSMLVKSGHTDLHMVSNQPAVSGDSNSKLVVATGWLTVHEVQLKDATVRQLYKISKLKSGEKTN